MDREFHFQPHIRYCEEPVMWFFAVLIAGAISLPLVTGPAIGYGTISVVRLAFYLTATFVCIALLARIVCRRWRFSRFVVTSDRLVFYGLWSIKAVSFSRIRSIWHTHFFYMFGVAIIRTDTATLYVPFIVDDLASLLRSIEERVASAGRGSLLSGRRFEKFVRAARVNDIINGRIYEDLETLISIVLLCGISGGFVARLIWNMNSGPAFIWIMYSCAFPLCTYLAANAFIALKVAKDVREHFGSEPAYDASVLHAWTMLAGILLYFSSGIAYLWLYEWLKYLN